jgi:hypothetical protein
MRIRTPREKINIALKIALFLLALLIAIFVIDRINREEIPRALISFEKRLFVEDMSFDLRAVVDGRAIYGTRSVLWVLHPGSPDFSQFHDELVFVHSQEEAQGFPDNVVVGWPRDVPWIHTIIEGINWTAENDPPLWNGEPTREPISLADFGFTEPITIRDLVDNWEQVNALWHTFDHAERDLIRSGWPSRRINQENEASEHEDEATDN